MSYEWIPGCGPSEEAVQRMRAHFPKPTTHMGEAWFMGDRKFYPELSEKPIEEIAPEVLRDCLYQISSGISSFGHQAEWSDWFKYLLPGLVMLPDNRYAFHFLVESIVSALMQVFWLGLDGEYSGFRDDVMSSLGLCLMKPEAWIVIDDKRPDELALLSLRWEEDDGTLAPSGWDAGETSPNLSAMLFFGLKYLRPAEIPSWATSLIAIKDPYWRAALMVWLLGAYDLLNTPIPLPSQLGKTNPQVNWADSHSLGSGHEPDGSEWDQHFNDNKEFLMPANNSAFVTEVRRQLTPELILEWTDAIAADAALSTSLLNTPELLFDKLTNQQP